MYNFKTVDGIQIQILEHIAVQKAKFGKNLKVHIGTDASSREGFLHYYLVVAFRYGSNGAHFVYHKEKIPVYRHKNGTQHVYRKLRKEADMTIEFCEHIISNAILTHDEVIIEMDYNGVKETISTQIIPETSGWAIGLGYKVITKNENHNLQIAVKAANFLSQS